MFNKKFTVLPEEMRRIVRYEKTFEEYENSAGDPFQDADFPCEYETIPEDLFAAMTNIQRKNPTMQELAMHWFFPLTFSQARFALQGTEETEPIFTYVLDELFEMLMQKEPTDRTGENESVKDAAEALRYFIEDANKPIGEMRFTLRQKRNLVHSLNDDDALNEASEEQVYLVRKFAQELADIGDEEALEMVGYGCYSGNRAFEQDFFRAKECLEALYEKTAKPMVANTLGYIHFYGRCGERDYAKAREYFLIASMGGLYQATYKMADMFAEGLGCPKNPAAAKSMYEWVYENCLKEYIGGNFLCEFCDAAVRLGKVYLEGIATKKDPMNALGYFLEAQHAVRQRMEHGGQLSDSSVAQKAREGIAAAREALEPSAFKKHIDFEDAALLCDLLRDARLSIKATQPATGHLKLHIQRQPDRYQEQAQPLLLTFPSMGFCEDVTKITVQALSGRADFDRITTDHCEWNDEEKSVEFFYDEELVGTVHCDGFRFTLPTPKKGKMVRLAGVTFSEYSRMYDYLCDDSEIQEEDRVLVPTREGETEVTVVKVHEEQEQDLALPLDKYKRVLRKL